MALQEPPGEASESSAEQPHAATTNALSNEALAQTAIEFVQQSENLSLRRLDDRQDGQAPPDMAVEAHFITAQDPVIVTAAGNRLPTVPLVEAHKLNFLKDELEGNTAVAQEDAVASEKANAGSPEADKSTSLLPSPVGQITAARKAAKNAGRKHKKQRTRSGSIQPSAGGSLERAMPPSHTNPLFPPLPLYGPPSLLRNLQSTTFQVSSFVLSLSFLSVILMGSLCMSIPSAFRHASCYLTLRDADADRPFCSEEKRRKKLRNDMTRSWKRRKASEERIVPPGSATAASTATYAQDKEDPAGAGIGDSTYVPTEGGPDPLIQDVGYYARRVGLDVESYEVQTEDGFVIDLWHVYDPREYASRPAEVRQHRGPGLLFDETTAAEREAAEHEMLTEQVAHSSSSTKRPKFPVLLIHGLLQSSGAYCVNDDDSLAFYLCKSGFDVWLGNNRCGFHPKHTVLHTSDPRMWCWNIRHMGVFDLPALVSRVLRETRFARLGLICHSQGTTEALVALAKEQRPELGRALTVFCALAPAAYAGRLIGKMYFKFIRVISSAMFRLIFGIHAFIPLMMQTHPLLPGPVFGWLGYRVFSFLFDWSDMRWDRGLRNRMFQFAPVYVSAESMRWWLGREGFAQHKCILSTKEEWRAEEREDKHQESQEYQAQHRHHLPGATAWYDERAPPMALWVCGRDDLVDGRRLLKRFLPHPVFAALDRGQGNRSTSSGPLRSLREPHVRVVHAKVLPEYEHLDVIWAMDAVDEVFREVREVLWKTCKVQAFCRVPKGCEAVVPWHDPAAALGGADKTVDETAIDTAPSSSHAGEARRHQVCT